MSDLEGCLHRLADGLWARLRSVLLAERRLERFAFTVEAGGGDPAGVARLAGDPEALGALSRDVTLRALAAGVEPVNFRLLACLGPEPHPLDGLARSVGLPRVAVTERVGALAQVGLATRDLERDGAEATPAGQALVALVEYLRGAVQARGRAELGTLE
jgi:CO/xanthine dehydrogenase Mo-binding subunit